MPELFTDGAYLLRIYTAEKIMWKGFRSTNGLFSAQ